MVGMQKELIFSTSPRGDGELHKTKDKGGQRRTSVVH